MFIWRYHRRVFQAHAPIVKTARNNMLKSQMRLKVGTQLTTPTKIDHARVQLWALQFAARASYCNVAIFSVPQGCSRCYTSSQSSHLPTPDRFAVRCRSITTVLELPKIGGSRRLSKVSGKGLEVPIRYIFTGQQKDVAKPNLRLRKTTRVATTHTYLTTGSSQIHHRNQQKIHFDDS